MVSAEHIKKKTYFRHHFQDDGFDLDVTYITEKVLVMGNPYNNDSLNELRRFLTSRHGGHHRIYNLASEEDFNVEVDLDNVENFPFPSNNPCAINVIIKFCSTIDVYLNLRPENVVVIHCRTGKGRCCLLTACYLLHSGVFTNADEAFSFVNRQRTPLRLNALSIPSQIRYLHYYEVLLKSPRVVNNTFRVTHIRMTTIPAFNASIVSSGCAPYVSISVLAQQEASLNPQYARDKGGGEDRAALWYPKQVYHQLEHEARRKLKRYLCQQSDNHADFDLTPYDVQVRGDVCLALHSNDEKMSQIYFHTAFVEGNHLLFDKTAIDLASKDTKCYTFEAGYRIDVFLQRVRDKPSINVLGIDDLDPSVREGSVVDHGGVSAYLKHGLPPQLFDSLKYGNLAMDESDEDNDIAFTAL